VPAHGRVVLAQHEPVGVVAPALCSHVRGTGARATSLPDARARPSLAGNAYLSRALVGMVTAFNKSDRVLISLRSFSRRHRPALPSSPGELTVAGSWPYSFGPVPGQSCGCLTATPVVSWEACRRP
jgi:hypothetical protein